LWLLASLLLLKDHLASKTEILAHLQDVVAAVKEEAQLEVITLFGYEFLGQHDTFDGVVECAVKWTGGDDSSTRAMPSLLMHLRAKRMIKATGYDIEIQKPLKHASQKVVSFSPADILRSSWNAYMSSVFGRDKPIYFVGSGKVSFPHVVLVDRVVFCVMSSDFPRVILPSLFIDIHGLHLSPVQKRYKPCLHQSCECSCWSGDVLHESRPCFWCQLVGKERLW
jgi:hypothetical protein